MAAHYFIRFLSAVPEGSVAATQHPNKENRNPHQIKATPELTKEIEPALSNKNKRAQGKRPLLLPLGVVPCGVAPDARGGGGRRREKLKRDTRWCPSQVGPPLGAGPRSGRGGAEARGGGRDEKC